MATSAGDGMSSQLDAREAGREAAGRACAHLPQGRADFCLVFGTSGYHQPALLDGVREVVGAIPLSGCSGEGVISGPCSDERERAVTVLAVQSDELTFEPLLLTDYTRDPAGRGAELARAVMAPRADSAPVVGLLVFPDGLVGDCSQFLRAVDAGLAGTPITVVGGAAGDAMLFERTFQFCNGAVASDAVAAVVIRGQGRMEVVVSHGCTPIGLERTITAYEGGWLHTIDGRPAWSVFKEYLDNDPEDLNAEGIVHLCIGQRLGADEAEAYDPYIIRTPLQLDKERGALFFPGGGLERGTRIQLTRRDPSRIKEGARECARAIVQRARQQRPAFVLQFDCAGRGRVLFGACAGDEIVRPVRQTIGAETPWVGFHTYGEIAPVGKRTYYHNYTVALCAVFAPG